MNVDYKSQYLKYKKKYVNLKKILSGGSKYFLYGSSINDQSNLIQNTLFVNDTIFADEYYKKQTNNSFEIYLDFLSRYASIGFEIDELSLNVLVGATSANNDDYMRFVNDNYYSIYIDVQVGNNTYDYALRQYNMYTINYNDLVKSLNDIPSVIYQTVNEIHFDNAVSYFTPLSYFNIASYLLKPGGKMIWKLQTHQITTLDENINHNEIEKLKLKYNIDSINHKMTPNENFYMQNNLMSPQYDYRIRYIENQQQKFYTSKDDFTKTILTYFSQMFTNFTFEIKTYSYSDYSYPVPITTIMTNNAITIVTGDTDLDDFFNITMSKSQLDNYLKNKKINFNDYNFTTATVQQKKLKEIHYYIIATKNKSQYYNKLLTSDNNMDGNDTDGEDFDD